MLQRCCRRRRTTTPLQANTEATGDIESDSDNIDVHDRDGSMSVQLYMPIDQVSTDSAGDSIWQNVMHDQTHRSSYAGASYIPLPSSSHHVRDRQWHVLNDCSDSSEADEPLVSFGQDCVPLQSTTSANYIEMSSSLMWSAADDNFRRARVEAGTDCRQSVDLDFEQQVAGATGQGVGVIPPHS